MTLQERWWLGLGIALVIITVYLLKAILAPFLAAALLAYLGDPWVDRIEARGWSRNLGVAIVFTILSLIFILSLLIVIPLLINQIREFYATVPAMLNWATQVAIPWVQGLVGVDVPGDPIQKLREMLLSNWQRTGDVVGAILRVLGQSSSAIMGWLVNLSLIPVVALYLLRDWDIVVGRLRELLPRHMEPTIVVLSQQSDQVLGAFIRGQLLVMLVLGIIYAIGLSVVGLPMGLLIGMVAGIASLVPYLGFIIGISIAILVAIISGLGFWAYVGIGVVFMIGQILEGMVLTPLLVGDKIGLHPVAVIFAILAGGELFGFTGVLLALPIAAVIMVVLRYVHEKYKQSNIYGSTSGYVNRSDSADDQDHSSALKDDTTK